MKKELYIIGAGSVGGHVALNLDEYSQEYNLKGFFDDDPEKVGTEQFGLKILGSIDEALQLTNAALVIGIAFPQLKKKILQKLSANSTFQYPSLVHSQTWISKDVTVKQGCIIYPGTTVNYGCEIQDFAVINMNCSLGHHTTVGAYSSLAPGVSSGGHTTIGEGADVGIGVSTIQDINIGKDSIVGGQSMVTKDVKPASKVAGVPARQIS